MRHMLIKNRQAGFTLVEVAIVAPLMILIAISILAVLITLVTSTVTPNARGIMMIEQQKAMDSLQKDIGNSTTLLAPAALPSGFSDSASSDYSSPPTGTVVLKAQTFNQTTDTNDTTGTKILPAFKGSSPCTNLTSLEASNIAPIVAVYFVKDSILYRRTLVDDTLATCATKLAKQTCISSCTSKDLQLISTSKVKKFDIIYYTSLTSDTVTTAPASAKSAKITITSTLDAAGQTNEYTSVARIIKLN